MLQSDLAFFIFIFFYAGNALTSGYREKGPRSARFHGARAGGPGGAGPGGIRFAH